MHHDSKITFTPCLPYFHHQTQPITHQRGLLHHTQIPPNLWHSHIKFFKGYWAIFYNKIIKWSKLLVPIRCWWNLIITHIIEKTYFVSIGLPTIPMICLRFHHYWETLWETKFHLFSTTPMDSWNLSITPPNCKNIIHLHFQSTMHISIHFELIWTPNFWTIFKSISTY
jgi:hypothetical protein